MYCVSITWIIYYLLLRRSVKNFCSRIYRLIRKDFARIGTRSHCQAIKCNKTLQYFAYVCWPKNMYPIWNMMISLSGIRLPHISPMQNISLYKPVKYMYCRKKMTTITQKRQVYCTKGWHFFIFSYYLFEYLIYYNFNENNNRLWFMNYNICVHVWNCRICDMNNIAVGSIIWYKLKFVNFMNAKITYRL